MIDAATGNDAGLHPRVAFDGWGNAFAVFTQSAKGQRIYANRWDGTAWGGPETIDLWGLTSAYDPKIACNGDGKAMVVFSQDNGTKSLIYANYWNGLVWEGAVPISDAGAGHWYASYPQVSFAGIYGAMAVFQEFDGALFDHVYANRFVGSSWSGLGPIEAGVNDALWPQIACYENGTALAAFVMLDSGLLNRVWANRWNGWSWEGPLLIDGGAETDWHLSPQIAFDGKGNAIALFVQYYKNKWRIYANRWNGSIWGNAEPIDAGDNAAGMPHIACDANGNAIAVFVQVAGAAQRLYANRWDGSAWSGPTIIDAGENNAYDPQAAFDNNGNAIVVFNQWDGAHNRVYANRWLAIAPTAVTELNGTSFGVGQRLTAIFRTNRAIESLFNVYAVIILPDGKTMLDMMTLSPKIKAIAGNVPGLPAGFSYRLLDITIPPGAPRGEYELLTAFFDPKAKITGRQDAFLQVSAKLTIH